MILSLWIPVNVLLLLLSAGAASPAETQSQSYPLSNGTTVYELLTKFGLPPGLLPDTVTSFSLAQNGVFEVNLTSTCYVNFEYLVFYEPRITGFIRYGEIGELEGIQVRRFLVWFNVDAIKVDLPPSKYIYFDVGWITKKLNIEQFKTVHSCQKGLAESMMEQTVGLYRAKGTNSRRIAPREVNELKEFSRYLTGDQRKASSTTSRAAWLLRGAEEGASASAEGAWRRRGFSDFFRMR